MLVARITAQPPFASLIGPPARRPPTALRPLPHHPVAMMKPCRASMLVAFEARTARPGAQPQFHFLSGGHFHPARPPQQFPICLPAASATRSDGQPCERAPD